MLVLVNIEVSSISFDIVCTYIGVGDVAAVQPGLVPSSDGVCIIRTLILGGVVAIR